MRPKIFVSNHYHCQVCHSEEYTLLTFKKSKNDWVECDIDDAEIGMAYCNKCKCDQMVHERFFEDKLYDEGKRPYEHLFWKKVDFGWTGFKFDENLRLYNEIYGKQVQINNYLLLKFENEMTMIYVNGELFQQCKFIMFNLPVAELEDYDEIDSIDEVSDLLRWTSEGQLDEHGSIQSFFITPEIEFWAHCSNLQVWAEHNYDTRLLHSNLSFPLLRKLTEVGDPIAKSVFQEEIYQRFESFYPTTIRYLLMENYLQFLTKEQKETLLESWMENDISKVTELLIGDDLLSQFGEQYRPLILAALEKKVKLQEKTRIEHKLKLFFKEVGIETIENFVSQLFSSDRNILKDLFDLRQYPVPEKIVSGISYTHIAVLGELNTLLTQLCENDKVIEGLITLHVRELFEYPSIANMFALLRYSYYRLLSLNIFKEMMLQENSPFLSNLFNYLAHDLMMRYYDSSLVPCDLIYVYFDDHCRLILTNQVKNLPPPFKRKVIYGLQERINHKLYHDGIVALLKSIREKSV